MEKRSSIRGNAFWRTWLMFTSAVNKYTHTKTPINFTINSILINDIK